MQDDIRSIISVRVAMVGLGLAVSALLSLGFTSREPKNKAAYGLASTALLVGLAGLNGVQRRMRSRVGQADEASAIDWAQNLSSPLIEFWKSGQSVQSKTFDSTEPFDGLEEVDIAEALASARSGSTLIACPSGSGKSNLLRAAIGRAHQHYAGAVGFKVLAGKAGEDYLGLEDGPDYVESTVESTDEVYATLLDVHAAMDEPDSTIILVADEYNNVLGDLAEGNNSELKKCKRKAYEIVTKGRSKGKYAWITSHSPYAVDIGFNGAIQESLNVICLGRFNKLASINKALSGKRAVIDDDERRAFLQWQFREYKKSADFDPSRVICLTNLRGDWELVLIPVYPDNPPALSAFSDLPRQEASADLAAQPGEALADFPQKEALEVESLPELPRIQALTPQAQKRLFLIVSEHLQAQRSKTYIIQKVLNRGGRKFADTSQLIDEVLILGKIRGWGP